MGMYKRLNRIAPWFLLALILLTGIPAIAQTDRPTPTAEIVFDQPATTSDDLMAAVNRNGRLRVIARVLSINVLLAA